MARVFQVLFLPGVQLADAAALEVKIARGLQSLGLLSTCEDERVDNSGRQIRRYGISENSGALFLKSTPDQFAIGDYVESTVGRYANGWSLNLAERYECPLCRDAIRIETNTKAFEQILRDMQGAIIEFMDTGRSISVRCPSCNASAAATSWTADVPAAMTHLAFEFSQFPAFDSNVVAISAQLRQCGKWVADIPRTIEEIAGQPVGRSMGRI